MTTTRNSCFDIDGTLIIGAGLAGLFTALKLAPTPAVILSPDPIGTGASSAWAQGGLAAAVGEGDTPEDHAADTIAAGAGLVDPEIALMVTTEARARVLDLLEYGAPFDRDEKTGALLASREAAHGTNRVIRVSGDRAGRAIMDALIAAARATPSITILENITVDDLAMANGKVIGAFARRVGDDTSEPLHFRATRTVLATGGVGGLYAISTNPSRVRGQGLGMAARAGAVISNPEFVQFHPTGMDVNRDPCPLATEALRGHGATVIDETGRRFVFDDHEDGELAPRDIVARAIHRKNLSGGQAYLDTRDAIGAHILDEFPTVAAYCKDAGIDPVTQPIPVQPAQHYHMGGIWTDAQGQSSLPGLYACGEVAATGLHGANRLASNSLLEAVVFAARIAQHIRSTASNGHLPDIALPPAILDGPGALAPHDPVQRLRAIMADHVGVDRTGAGLRAALAEIAALEAAHAPASRAFLNMTHAATLIAAAALTREESRGGHYRSDMPELIEPATSTQITLTEAIAIRDACKP